MELQFRQISSTFARQLQTTAYLCNTTDIIYNKWKRTRNKNNISRSDPQP